MPITVEYTAYHGDLEVNQVCWLDRPRKGKLYGKLRPVSTTFEDSLSAHDWNAINEAIRDDYEAECEAAAEFRAECRRDD